MYITPQAAGNTTRRDLYDTTGNKLGDHSFTFDITDIKKDKAKFVDHEIVNWYKNAYWYNNASSFKIHFKDGAYPAKYIFMMTKPKVNKDLYFEDDFFGVSFSISKEQVGYVLYNKTSNPIKIDWNQVSFVDVLGNSHKVMHSGIKYIDRINPQAPTVIPPTAKLEDIIFPIDYVDYVSGAYGVWRELPLFPEAPKAKLFKGKSFSVFMPLEINEVIKNYLFTFKIDDIQM